METPIPALAALTLALAALTAAPRASWAQSPEAEARELEDLVDSIAAEHVGTTLAGMSVGVVRGDETLLKKAYGHADLEWNVPMPMDAVHEIGSVTKQFTSVAVLQLVEEGRIDLDADMTEYLPDFDTQGRTVPVRSLLNHTSGIRGATEIPEFGDIARLDMSRDSLLRIIEAHPFDFEPGEALIYNNSGFILLGHIIEKASGQSYEDYIEERVFPLAGMEDSSYCSNSAVVENRAHGYQAGSDGLVRAEYHDHTWPYSAGSLCSTISDLIAWNRALHGGNVLPRNLYRMLVTPDTLNDGTPLRYAMGMSHYRGASGRVIEHGGGIQGFLTHSRYYPDQDAIIVVLLNTSGPPGPVVVANAIGKQLFGDDKGPEAATFEGSLVPLMGKYRGPARGRTLTVTIGDGDGGLTFSTGGEPQPIHYLDGTTFFRGNNRYTFIVEEGAEEAVELRMDGVGGHYVLAAVDEVAEAAARPEIPTAVLEEYVGRYELSETFAIEVTRDGDQIFVQATNQSRLPAFADSETEFHLEAVEASIEFVRGENGEVEAVILHQGGRSQRAERVGG